jgi:hypothetical protein
VLDRLADEGVRFENAFVPQAGCSQSRAALLTGLYPHQNGQIGLATWKFRMCREDTPKHRLQPEPGWIPNGPHREAAYQSEVCFSVWNARNINFKFQSKETQRIREARGNVFFLLVMNRSF